MRGIVRQIGGVIRGNTDNAIVGLSRVVHETDVVVRGNIDYAEAAGMRLLFVAAALTLLVIRWDEVMAMLVKM